MPSDRPSKRLVHLVASRPVRGFQLDLGGRSVGEETRSALSPGGRFRSLGLILALAFCGCLLSASSAWAANFTWTGEAPVGEAKWSNTANWGGSTLGGSVGTLTFAKLTRPACTAKSPTETCNTSTNDLTGLTVEAIAIDADANYGVGGNEITLGSGGITATASEGVEGFASLFLPMKLGAPQTWSVDGGEAFGDLNIGGSVTGAQPLHVDLSHRARASFNSEIEVGAVTIVGGNPSHTGSHAVENGFLEAFELNGTDGSPVNLIDAELATFVSGSSTIGPLTSTGGAIPVAGLPAGKLTVSGGVTLDGASEVRVGINKSGTIAGTDYSQLSASGPIALAGELNLEGLNQSGSVCPTLHPGDADTLITTTGALSGQFAGVPDEQLVPVRSLRVEGFEEVRPRCATARIHYTANSVTATIVSVTPPPSNVSPPSISGNTWVGQTLSANAGVWKNEAEPGGYSGPVPQWEDCDAAGNGCTPIEGAFEPTYTLTAADVGHTIRLREAFFNVAGTSPPVESPATGVVTSSKPEPKLPPSSTAPPTISGSAVEGQTLTESHGAWANGPSNYSYQWQRCDGSGNSCTSISGALSQSYVPVSGDVGHALRVQETASNAAGSGSAATSTPTGAVSGGGVQGSKSVAPPILGQRQTATVSSGTVTARAKGTSTFIALVGATSIADGSEVDAINGRVTITAAGPNGGTVSAEVYGGRFRVHQDSSGETHFTLTLALTGCPRVGLPKGSAAALAYSAKRRSGPKSRHLWVSETGGKWGTNGRYVSTSVEGTTWLTVDECTQSQVKVAAGTVKVRDLVRKKTKTVNAGKRYLAKASTRHK